MPATKENTPSPRRLSRTAQVYGWLVDQMLSGQLLPGATVVRREVAKTLGLSVSPVGEAMLQLENEGLLQSVPRVGTRVALPSRQDIWGTVMARLAIECQTARILASKPLPDGELTDLAERADAAPDKSMDLIRADAAFHRGLVKSTGCPALLGLFDRVIRQNLLFISLENLPPRPREKHRLLLERLQHSDADEAEALIRKHVQSGKWIFASEQAWPALENPPLSACDS